MSAIKEVLGDIDLEVLGILLEDENDQLIEDIELFNNVGGNETYQMWAIVYGYEHAKQWYDNRGDAPVDMEVVNQCRTYTFNKYIEWLKSLNY